MSETYEKPPHGWTCFHCGETFTTVGNAEDHFGATPIALPGCLLKVQLGNERGMLMELRKLQEENTRLHTEISDEVWNDRAFYARLELDLMSYGPFRKCKTIQDVFNLYDSMEGRALAAEERVAEIAK